MCHSNSNNKSGMNAEAQSAYISLASNFYATRMRGVELNELNIIGALLRAAPITVPIITGAYATLWRLIKEIEVASGLLKKSIERSTRLLC